MGGPGRTNASVQAYLTPSTSPVKSGYTLKSAAPLRDGFTAEEVQEALRLNASESWHPAEDYADCEISDLYAGPRAVSFMGRVANIFDSANMPKTPRSAKGCVKLCVKDCGSAITVRLWYASQVPRIQLGNAVSIWTNHISKGENAALSSASAPLFASIFPERDRSCHIMVHNNSDDGRYRTPLGYTDGIPLDGLMTLQSFINGGYDVADVRILVVVKSIGSKKRITRKDETVTENINVQVHDDTAEATLGLWGAAASSPCGFSISKDSSSAEIEAAPVRQVWKIGETVLLIQAPGWKMGRSLYLNMTAATLIDVDPYIPDTDWLRSWSKRQKVRESINPPFPADAFQPDLVKTGPVRCLFTIAELDEFARCAPDETFQGYLSLLILEFRLLDCYRRNVLLSGECCSIALYANSMTAVCKGCDREVQLRLSPRIVGQVIDETAVIATGKLLFSDDAWRDLLGRGPEDILKMDYEKVKYLSDRLLFSRVTVLFGWSGDESKAGGRICVFGVRS